MEKTGEKQEKIKEMSNRVVKILPLGLILGEEKEPSESMKDYIAEQILSILGVDLRSKKIDDELLGDLGNYVDKYRKNIHQIIGKLAEVEEFRTQLGVVYSRETLRSLRKNLEKVILGIRERTK